MLSEQGEDGRETVLVSIPKAILVGQSTGNRTQEYQSKEANPSQGRTKTLSENSWPSAAWWVYTRLRWTLPMDYLPMQVATGTTAATCSLLLVWLRSPEDIIVFRLPPRHSKRSSD